MQSFREQSSYHGNQQTYSPEAHRPSSMEEYSPREQAQIFQSSYGGRRGGTVTPTTMASGENSSLQSYQAYRKESGDFYYLGNKEGSSPGSQTPQRRPPGPVQSYGPPQGNTSSSSTGFSSHFGREGHHSQFASQPSAAASISQYSQDFPGSYSPSGSQYSSHVPSPQLRQQLYQSHQPLPQSGNTPASTGSSHLQQMQRSPGYPLRVGQFEQHYQSSAGSTSSSFPLQRFGQSGTNYEGYSPGGSTSPYESHISGSSYGTQQGCSSYASQHLKNFDTAKIPQSGGQGEQPQNPPNVLQYLNSSKLLPQNQTGQFNQSEVTVQSPMQFQPNFSPISNPSPAASVVQSPSCSSSPSPLMTSGENIQCGQGNVPLPTRNRILPVMPQLSPSKQLASFKGFDVEGLQEKHLTDPGLSSLSALSSQVANLPNTVQHMLLSDALSPHKKGGKRTSRKTDSCANSETSSQAEEQLKSPMAESLDGSCSSSSGDQGERVRQLSGQSSSSEMGFKGLPSEKTTSTSHVWQNELLGKTAIQQNDTVPEPEETFQEIPKASEKSVGVIVSMETVANRPEQVVDDDQTSVNNDVEQTLEPELPEMANEENVKDCSNSQDGEPNTADTAFTTTTSILQIESVKSPVDTGFGLNDAPSISRNPTNPHPKKSEMGNFGGQSDRKSGRGEKYPSLLQEVLQGHHQQERRYAVNTHDNPAVAGSPEVPSRPNVFVNQTNDQPNRTIFGKSLAPHLESSHWTQWDRKSILEMKQINMSDYPANRKFEIEPPTVCPEQSSVPSERRSVICDISPLRQLVREPNSSQNVGTAQERPPEGRPGQSVILPSGILSMERSTSQGMAKGEDIEFPKVQKKRTGKHCMPYNMKDSAKGNASPKSLTHEPNQSFSSHNNRVSNPKRGTGRVGSRGRSPAQSQELSNRLKMSPGRSHGATEVHHINPTMSLSERASREALYSAFFPKTDSSTLGYHTNSRSSSYGEPHPTFTSLHYKRHIYQQEQYKEWLGNSAQAILAASQHRHEVLRKSQRQEPFHVRSPGRSENEGLGYSQQISYHESSNIDYGRHMRMGEGTNVALKRNSQKSPSREPLNWHLGQQASPLKKVVSPVGTNQKPFNSIRESETHGTSAGESIELPKLVCNAHQPSGPEEVSHHNPLVMRRRVRSFISPIPSKKQLLDDKGRLPNSISKEGPDKTPTLHSLSPRGNNGEFLSVIEESSKSGPEQRSPPPVSLSSPTKTKILPPRKGRGLKLEAIVQKITSPNVRRISASSSSENAVEPVTLDDFLSLKGKDSESGNGLMHKVERAVDILPDLSNNEELKLHRLSPKSFNTWNIQDDKQIKKEIDEQSMEAKDLSQSRPQIQQTSNHVMEDRGASPALVSKCPLPPVQPQEVADKDKLIITPKQEIIPPKGYFPSGKKKGRPIGSVNKQKKQLQEEQQLEASITVDLTSSPPPVLPPLPQNQPEQTFESEPKPRRRERRKQGGTMRRRRGKQAAPIVAPIEPEIKLKYASQAIEKTETKTKSFFPYIHVENKKELGLSCVIINAEEEEQNWKNLTSVQKRHRTTSPQPTESKVLPISSFMIQGPAVTESALMGHLVCCFCGKWANYKNLGDLFGPFYTQEYASTLSKNPPPKKSSETPQKVKVRHKDALDGSKTDSDEEEEEPQQAREQRSLSAHPRYKRRNRSGDCVSSRHAVPSRRKTTDPCELLTDCSGQSTADVIPDQGFPIPQLPLDSNEFWIHEGCVLWVSGVYFVCGRLYGLQEAFGIARDMICAHCQEPGATLGCFSKGCTCCYHYPCAMDSECLLSEENLYVHCPSHKTDSELCTDSKQPERMCRSKRSCNRSDENINGPPDNLIAVTQ
ncbi:transcription factor 20-like isoform X2 [Pseudophryne corroboree]